MQNILAMRQGFIEFLVILFAVHVAVTIEGRNHIFTGSDEISSSPWQTYISDLYTFHFQKCSIVFVQWDQAWRHNQSQAAINSQLLIMSDQISLLSHKIFFEERRLVPSYQLLPLPDLDLGGFKDSNKLNSACKVVVTVVNTIEDPKFSQLFFDKLTPTQDELTKRDEDYYIFVGQSHSVVHDLKNSLIVSQLRFKIIIQPNNHKMGFEIQSICGHCRDKFPKISKNPWEEISTIFKDFTRNFHQSSIRLTGPSRYKSSFELQKQSNGSYSLRRGLHVIYLQAIAQKLNMTFTVQYCRGYGNIPEGSSGILLANGEWAGCMRDILKNVSDWSVLVGPGSKRYGLVHFTPPLYYARLIFVTGKPGLYYPWTTIATAFTSAVWIPTILSIVIVTLTIFIAEVCFKTTTFKWYRDSDLLLKIGLHIFGYLIGQDVPEPTRVSSKLLYLVWLCYGLVIGSAYASSLQSRIVSPGKEQIPATFFELYNSDFKWGTPKLNMLGLAGQLFKFSDNPMLQQIFKAMNVDPDYASCDENALKRRYACINWEKANAFTFKTMFADHSGYYPFSKSREAIFFASVTHIARKREIFNSHFDDFMRWSFAMDLSTATLNRDWAKFRLDKLLGKREGTIRPIASKYIPSRFKSFSLENIKGCIFIIISGLALSLIVFIFECNIF